MELLVAAVIFVFVLVLLLWAVYYLPLPPNPPYLKNFLIAAILVIAAIAVIVYFTRYGAIH